MYSLCAIRWEWEGLQEKGVWLVDWRGKGGEKFLAKAEAKEKDKNTV